MAAIAFIGLGQMGSPMASNLLQQGHQLRVFDVNAEAVRHLPILAWAKVADFGTLNITIVTNAVRMKIRCTYWMAKNFALNA